MGLIMTIKKMILICLSVLLILTVCFTELFPNAWSLLCHNGYFIPAESSVFTFKATQMNEGSGEWWLYGEDKKYYYALNTEAESSSPYFKLEKGKEPAGFNKYNYQTWYSF